MKKRNANRPGLDRLDSLKGEAGGSRRGSLGPGQTRSRQGSIQLGGQERRGSYYEKDVTTRATVAMVTDDPDHKSAMKEGLAGAFANEGGSIPGMNGGVGMQNGVQMVGPDGKVITTGPGGAVQMVGPDGKMVMAGPGGAVQMMGPDGKMVQMVQRVGPDGKMQMVGPDGKVHVVGPDGKIPGFKAVAGGVPDGQIPMVGPGGTVQMMGPDGKMVQMVQRVGPDGKMQMVGPDGKIPGFKAVAGGGAGHPGGAGMGGFGGGTDAEMIARMVASGMSEADIQAMMGDKYKELSPESRALMQQIMASGASQEEMASRVAALLAGTALSTSRGLA